ncbi:hypothetical protein N7488_003254 [Penicillium malachiteum]|nr:hypothetical protein N7488_003254 [Penicillium malachiteum]
MADNKQGARRLTRCRTGCMRCRVRRRKCDEGKPRCRNCIDRNFQCQYGPQLSFLTKNAHTVQQSEVGTSAAQYAAIQFVNEDPQKGDLESDLARRDSSPLPDQMAEPSHIMSEQEPEPEVNPMESNVFKTTHMWPSDEVTQHTPQPITSAFTDNDESAVAGLLALGTSTDEIIETNLTLSDFAISPPTREPIAPLELPDVTAYSSLDLILNPSHAKLDLSSTETLELLRHYRYNIAPWLDICDQGQTFGIQGLQLAMISQAVYDSVMTLSGISMNKLQSSKQDHRSDAQLDLGEIAFLRALDAAKNCVVDVPSAWTKNRLTTSELFDALSPHALSREFNSAVYWLLVRLGMFQCHGGWHI